ncbi:4-amino-4-deoxychorismate lyase component of para-aminobenzoate synthase multienzyme complex [Wigglesworthia glossinidia endosymbiont of Glossina morsitans morsitans (Yale colony)]|uniref:Aminodeoxychorismate lyase n=1 Tax=Wigglesworthia glossinidia endosymbiont of Glossina morsitans morsitans (Yale colony) TaxID=1142511 RepID=H6Q5Q3_WIGGL|nr:aminodeoxychorismate lyase [Wigglesworthia glossinidia]AFA40958.1 4-amino-4-deoxychorismate lyase component of para-aminobenzoate synthase multienzyme complex [Wigglesworthia glossinidia endosymbiont of Glossina morsitans morsitans (Yale colony)]
MRSWINGIETDQISISNRSLQFGDGFFTTFICRNGRIEFLKNHFHRLLLAEKKLFFNKINFSALHKEVKFASKCVSHGIIKIIIIRGNSIRGYKAKQCIEPIRIIILTKNNLNFKKIKKNGAHLYYSPIKISRNLLLSGIKHNNKIEQVLASIHLENMHKDEAIILDNKGFIVECCTCNIFWRIKNFVFTPNLKYCGVPGIIRKKIINLLPKLGYKIIVSFFKRQHLFSAEEVFITNSIFSIIPVKLIENKHFLDRTTFKKIRYFFW